MTTPHKPGDVIIDHFMPGCSEEDREIARERLQQFAGWLVRIAIRQTRETFSTAPDLLGPKALTFNNNKSSQEVCEYGKQDGYK